MEKIKILIVFLLPLLLLAHEQDEGLFSTTDISPSALILLDRSGSMGWDANVYDTTLTVDRTSVILSGFNHNHSTHLEGWYDEEIWPDGPGDISDFNESPADDVWRLTIRGASRRDTAVVSNWKLRFYSGGSYTEFDGGSFSLETDETTETDIINVSSVGTVDSVECFLNVNTYDYWYWRKGRWRHQVTEIGDIQIDLEGPALVENIERLTRIQVALEVIHSLLDANDDGFVTEEDEKFLSIDFGQGCHRDTREHTPKVVGPNDSYDFSSPMNGYWHSRLNYIWYNIWHDVYSYNETTRSWEPILDGDYTMETDDIGTSFIDIWNHINYTEPFGATPNGPLVAEGVDYIGDFRSAYPELWCKKHNIILITDGETNEHEECDDNDAKDLVRQAYRAWHDDSIKVFAVGFGDDLADSAANQLNWTAFHGGTQSADSAFIDSMISEGMDTTRVSGAICGMRDPNNTDHNFLTGYAYIANDASALALSLKKIFTEISGQREKGFSSAEVTSIEEDYTSTGYEARMYLASFFPGEEAIWEGHMRSVKLVTGGLSFDDIPDSLVYWDAGNLLRDRDPATRSIYGVKSDSLLSFTSANFDSSDLGVASSSEANEVINLVRSGNVVMQDTTYLGDIFHSSPLRVGSPNSYYLDDDFDEYRDSMSTRSAVIYAGSNTGLLHAFSDETGEELFAVVPQNFVPQVKALEDSHRFYVDADAMAADVWFPSSESDTFKEKNAWRTVLMSSQGEGGRGITCLNVTDPTTPSHLFSFEHDTMGLTTSVPVMYKVGRIVGADTLERFFAFFGGGECPDSLWDRYNPATASDSLKGNVIVALDIYKAYTDGLSKDTTFWFIPPASGDADRMVYPFASAGSMVNLNSKYDNRYDLLYIPDLAGQMWKVDVRDPDISTWKARCIFQPPIPDSAAEDSIAQPAFFAPLIEREPALGCYWVFYGTGDRAHIFKENTNNRFYAILDTVTLESGSYPLNEYYNLKNAWTEGPFNISIDFPDDNGWFISYSDSSTSSTHVDEKTVSQAVMLKDTLIFSTFEPTESATDCNIGGGGAREYYCQYKTGGGRIRNLGGGIPQAPRYSFGMDGGVFVVHQTSDSILVETGTGYGTLKRILKWMER